MQCPKCSALLPEDDVFCEECGERLTPEPPAPPPFCLCGAAEDELDEDGYCLSCGRRCRPSKSDHVEIELSSDFAAVSDRGQQHTRNEDRVALRMEEGRSILVVCDGVSTASSSDAAAELACECVPAALAGGASLSEAVEQAQKQVRELGRSQTENCPSTTIVAVVVAATQMNAVWLGDSRAYWIAEAGTQQLTHDHSWLNDVVSAGEMSAQDAAKAPQAHGITRWLGADADEAMKADMLSFVAPGPGWLLVCTDGLWNYAAEPDDMARLVNEYAGDGASALTVARRLVDFANSNGGRDNITAALLRVGSN